VSHQNEKEVEQVVWKEVSEKLSEDFVHFNCDHNFLNNSLNQDVLINNTVIEILLDSIV